MKKQILFITLLIIASLALPAQVTLAPSVIAAGGGYAESDNISISWTLGELAVSTLTGNSMMLTQGFQQPFDIGVGIDENELSRDISAYPNPVGDELRIRFNIEKPGNFLIEIQDVTGRLVSQEQRKQVNPGDIILLNTASYTNGIYFLKVSTPDHNEIQVISLRKL